MFLKSPFSDVVVPEVPCHDALLAAMSGHGGNIALVNGNTGLEYTFAQLVDNSKKAASGLCRLGVRKSDIVCIYCPTAPEYAFMFIGSWANGASVTTCNPSYTDYELLHHLQDAQPAYLFTSSEQLPRVRLACETYKGIKAIISLDSAEGCVAINDLLNDDGSMYPSDVVTNPKEDVAVIPYSSGTTGLPKGVMLTHFNILANLTQFGHEKIRPKAKEGDPRPVVLCVIPFFHMFGMEYCLFANLYRGVTLVTLPRFEPNVFLGAIEKYKVTDMAIVPPILVFLTKTPLINQYDLTSLLNVTCGAAPLKESTVKDFLARLNIKRPFIHAYGMTEVTCVALITGQHDEKPESVGFLVPNMEAKIVKDAGKLCEPGELGELLLRGPSVMKGYLNQQDKSQQVKDSEGFLRTGDLGYCDKDGYFFIVDRLKEVIKYKGFQVAPAELEALLLSHPDVGDVGVIGVLDEKGEEVPRAYIAKRPGSTVSAEELHEFVKNKVAHFKQLRGGVEFIETIPKSPSGKILRRQLVKRYKDGKTSN